ncbi:MAG: CRISPR system precrRNA processing endoribonuclease RAMP protein Cas6 [Candidatus Bathyarchaeia archaeon]
MRLYPFVPHPFVLEPPFVSDGIVSENETIQFRLILIGRGMEFFPYFLYTFVEMGKTGLGKQRIPFVVQEVIDQHGKVIYQDGSDVIQPLPEPMEFVVSDRNDYNSNSLTIEFETPLRMTHNNKQAKEFVFSSFLGAALRRLSSLAYFHQGFELSLNFRGLLDKAQKIEVHKENSYYQPFKRYSARQKKEMDLGGIMGRFTLFGDLSPFISILRAGEILHVGKGTSFGLGKYRIVENAKKWKGAERI